MILDFDESQNIEYKESWNDKYLEWICGFANAQGGRVIIGVNDAHEIVGVSDSKRLMEDIPNKIVTHLGIVADVNLHKAGELDYIDIQVASNSVPISCRGHYYYRSGSTRQELKGVALQEFIITGVEFQIGRFGKDEGDLLEQDIIEGNIIQMADRVMEVLRFKYLHAPIHFEGMQRIETLEIPDKAFREILYNAIAHKLYSGAAIQMHVYDDRIEVWNDGGLPEGYTPETLLRQHSSKPRNKNIAYTFFKAGFIDRWGLGYRKIIDGFKEAGMIQPAIELVDGGVRVTVWRRKTANGVGSVSEVQLTDRQRQICNMLSENPSISAREMSEVLSVAQRTVERELSKMQDRGIISREGNTSAGRWLVLKMQQ